MDGIILFPATGIILFHQFGQHRFFIDFFLIFFFLDHSPTTIMCLLVGFLWGFNFYAAVYLSFAENLNGKMPG